MTLGVMFPGQGSQAVGMLSGLDHPAIGRTLAEADAALGWAVSDLIANGPAVRLHQTEFTQPALLAADIAVWRAVIEDRGLQPAVLAGHSLGEFAALVAAGSMAFADALRVVQRRGRLMQDAVPEGAGGMAAVIGMADDEVEALCARCEAGVLEAVNFNAPGQVVVAGERAALGWLEEHGPPAGARMVKVLPVSVPSHCRLMREAADALGEVLAAVEIQPPRIPVLHNLDALPRSRPEAIREALREQLYRPVRWTRTLESMREQGVTVLAECGPGNVLCGLAKRGARGIPAVALSGAGGADALLKILEESA